MSSVLNTNFDKIIEGQLDDQTIFGKTIDGVLKSARHKNIPVAAFCGSVDISMEAQKQLGLTYITSITKGITDLDSAMKLSYQNLVFSTYNFCQILK